MSAAALALLPSRRTLLALFAFIVSVGAAGADDATGGDSTTTDVTNALANHVTVQSAIAAVILIIAGCVVLFFGHRLFYPTLFVGGFFFFASLAYVVLVNAEPTSGYSNRSTLILCVVLVAGIVGGLLAICLVKLGITLVGAAGGFALALFVLSWKSGGVIESGLGRTIFIIACIIIGAIVIHFVIKSALIVFTSIAGAFGITLGIDFFAQTGFAQTVQSILIKRTIVDSDVSQGKVVALLVTTAVLAAIGMIVQFRSNRGRTFGPQKRL
ncbi:hypothetical protein HDU87_007907 [Geranomyces variabilis]|uniref:Transmembrane protein 198 n=1 Tax=Geranomyces variabilis TaxID=109894 RepID=A0AAD5TDE0_9FUNG|nr:hypothetical protein HDU87_007907 [Geranomyces variabilis]